MGSLEVLQHVEGGTLLQGVGSLGVLQHVEGGTLLQGVDDLKVPQLEGDNQGGIQDLDQGSHHYWEGGMPFTGAIRRVRK